METNALLAIAQVALAFLSVPVVGAVLATAFRYFVPSSRLAMRLQRDLAIYKELPSSPQKVEFQEGINRTLAALNARLDPEIVAKRNLMVRNLFAVIGGVLLFLFGLALVGYGFLASYADGSLVIFLSAMAGAVTTYAVYLVVTARRRSASSAAEIDED